MKSLPISYKARKELPLYDFMFGYFPLAWLEVVKVAIEGNNQHNPGERLHWARHKSTDQLNTAFRHLFDHGTGVVKDIDDTYHLAKTIWRLMAELQLIVEKNNGKHSRRARKGGHRQAPQAVRTPVLVRKARSERNGHTHARLSRHPLRRRVRNRSKKARRSAH